MEPTLAEFYASLTEKGGYNWGKDQLGKLSLNTKLKDNLIDFIERESLKRRLALKNEIIPHASDLLSSSPNPDQQYELSKSAFKARQIGWRAAQYTTLINVLCEKALALYNQSVKGVELSLRSDITTFLYNVNVDSLDQSAFSHDGAWNLKSFNTPFDAYVKAKHLVYKVSDEEKAVWSPDFNKWDIEQVGLYELMNGFGGFASIIALMSTSLASDEVRIIQQSRVDKYIKLNLANPLRNPFDPNNWGHDLGITTFTVWTNSSKRAKLALVPEYSDDIDKYDVALTANSVIEIVFRDTATTFVSAGARTGGGKDITITTPALDKRIIKLRIP